MSKIIIKTENDVRDDFDSMFMDSESEFESESESESEIKKIDTSTKLKINTLDLEKEQDVICTICDLLSHTQEQVISSSQAFDIFLSFVTTFTKHHDVEYVKKCMLYVGCTSCEKIGKFMLENSKCSVQMMTEPMVNTKKSVMYEIVRYNNSELLKCIITNFPNYMQLLVQSNSPDINPPLFHITSEKTLEYLVETNCLTEDILKNTIGIGGNNYFQHMCTSGYNILVKYLLKTDICTRDVIIGKNNWNKFITYLKSKRTVILAMIIQSGKLLNEDFESNYKNKPLYFEFLKKASPCNDLFLLSPYCTGYHVEKYLDSEYTQFDNSNGEMKRLFSYEKFKYLENKYSKKSNVNPTESVDKIQDFSVEIKQLKKEIEQLKNIILSTNTHGVS